MSRISFMSQGGKKLQSIRRVLLINVNDIAVGIVQGWSQVKGGSTIFLQAGGYIFDFYLWFGVVMGSYGRKQCAHAFS